MNKRKATEIRVDFSLKREVFFVVIGAMLGAVSMLIPTAFEVRMGLPYYITWVAFGHVIGVYSSNAAFAGIGIHTITAISIGIVIGVFLYKTGILNISKISNGLLYGVIRGFRSPGCFFHTCLLFYIVTRDKPYSCYCDANNQ
jgi:hypothetical protein